MMSSSPRSRIARTKRACDGCQIRKVKCDGGQPCLSCANTQIACTFSRTVHTRGPRRMRETTRNIIERIQRQERHESVENDGNSGLANGPAEAVSTRHGYVDACTYCLDRCQSLTASIMQDVEPHLGRNARTATVHILLEDVSRLAHRQRR